MPGKKLSQGEYNKIAGLWKEHPDASYKRILVLSGLNRSMSLVARIKYSPNWEDYCAQKEAQKLVRRKKFVRVEFPSPYRLEVKTRLPQKTFDFVKLLVSNNVSQADIKRVAKVANATIRTINSVNTYEEYGELIRKRSKERIERLKAEQAQSQRIEPQKQEESTPTEEPKLGVWDHSRQEDFGKLTSLVGNMASELNLVIAELHRLESTNAKLEERILYIEDYVKTIAESVPARSF